ncbi:MAG: C25 family cysteine peptidase, partial [Candidatus Cloacimonadaceae bacterium]|nr:C25 family cysteine peptidase [Candidatus Cloacimonadaceae bacterium]
MRMTIWSTLLLALLLTATTPAMAEMQANTPAFTIVSRSAGHMDIRFDLPTYELLQETHGGTNYQKIVLNESSYLSTSGLPELPVLSTLIAIPDQGSAWVELISSHTQTIEGIIPIPVQEEGSAAFSISKDYYQGLREQSDEVVIGGEPQLIRDLRVIPIQVQPFIWDPISHDMLVHQQITLRLHLSPEPGPNQLFGSRQISSQFDKIYNSLVLNYDDYRSAVIANSPARILMIHGSNSDPIFQNQLSNFALWKRQKGAEVQVVSTAVTGSANSDIKTYLQAQYDNPQTRPDFVILIGDITGAFAVPAWNIEGFGDYPYQMLAGNDMLGDVFLGRISAENTSQLEVILSKIYAYEKNINVTNAQWLDRMLLTSDTLYNGISVVYLSYYIRDISLRVNPNYTYTMLNQHSPSPSAMNNAINQGVGFFNYRGYAGMSGWSVNDSNLINLNRLCHAVILTCNTGNYDATATTEQFIRVGSAAAPKGAVTAIGMWGAGTATMPNNALSSAIFAGIFTEGMRTMGEALLHSKLYFSSLYGISNPPMSTIFNQWCNLMGDPSMEVYVTIPRTFASNAPASIVSGTNGLDLVVVDANGFPVQDASVTITHNATIISRGYTDAAGLVYLPFSTQLNEGSAVLTISKHDFKPLQQSIPITAGSLLAGIPLIDDDNQGQSVGNGNGIANAGESLEVLFMLRNTSSDPITGISGQISSSDPLVTIADTLLSFSDIAPGANAFSLNPVLIHISAATANNTLLRFSLQLTDADENEYLIADHISVTDADLRFESSQIIGGGNAVLDPGETAAFSVTLRNIGNSPVADLVGELFTGNDLVAVIDSLGAFGSILPNGMGSTQTDNFILMGRDALIPGMVIPLRLRLTNPAGFMQWLQFSITVGTVTVNDPLGPDNYGYLI